MGPHTAADAFGTRSAALGGAAGTLRAARARRLLRRRAWMGVLAVALLAVAAALLCLGATAYSPGVVLRVLLGEQVRGATFAIGELRAPRLATGLLAGAAFGAAGVTFQTMLRNPLASPDVIGITTGASAVAVLGITVLGLSGPALSTLAVAGGLATSFVIASLSRLGESAGIRLVLVGIGVGAMLQSLISYLMLRADTWQLTTALRWLTGSLSNASWSDAGTLAVACALGMPLLGLLSGRLDVLRLGDDTATALGVRVGPTRLGLVGVAVALLAIATAATGPIAFVSFLAGPIAVRLVGASGSPLLPAALVGALLVTGGDLLAQHVFPVAYPVGVVTGVVGAPYLLYLLVRTRRSGGSL